MNDEPGCHAFRARRRGTLVALGGAGAWLLGSRSLAQTGVGSSGRLPACVLTPAQTEGPYFVDGRLDRSDIRADPSSGTTKPGALLMLELGVSSMNGAQCLPVESAIVDIWHCDAAGAYSDADDMSVIGPLQGTNSTRRGSRFLRGYQVTDSNGIVRFTTIYPGAYPGRAVHVHFKVRMNAGARGRHLNFTSQLYFDDALTDRVHAAPPYSGAQRRTRNPSDGLYRQGGRELQLGVASVRDGYAARYDIGLRSA